jgi:NADP-dependent 3-hydroxy acid dehydrogenase YdfG
MNGFSGQTAIITGATGGIGKAIAARLIASGGTAFLLGRSQRTLDELVRESGWNAAYARCYEVDLAVEEEVAEFGRRINDACSHVHFLVHAAGIIALGTLEKSDLADFDKQYQVNVRAPYQLTQVLLPRMVTCGGQVVFINSSVGITAREGVSQYAATKHALRALGDSLRDEVNGQGVRVLSVFLGRMASRMQAAVHQHEARPYHPERLLQPDDVASVIIPALLVPRTAEVTELHIRPMLKS